MESNEYLERALDRLQMVVREHWPETKRNPMPQVVQDAIKEARNALKSVGVVPGKTKTESLQEEIDRLRAMLGGKQ